jgi:hypothetical protein
MQLFLSVSRMGEVKKMRLSPLRSGLAIMKCPDDNTVVYSWGQLKK